MPVLEHCTAAELPLYCHCTAAENAAISKAIATKQPYKEWLSQSLRRLEEISPASYASEAAMDTSAMLRLQAASGMGAEDAQMVVEGMAQAGEPATAAAAAEEGATGAAAGGSKGESAKSSRDVWCGSSRQHGVMTWLAAVLIRCRHGCLAMRLRADPCASAVLPPPALSDLRC